MFNVANIMVLPRHCAHEFESSAANPSRVNSSSNVVELLDLTVHGTLARAVGSNFAPSDQTILPECIRFDSVGLLSSDLWWTFRDSH